MASVTEHERASAPPTAAPATWGSLLRGGIAAVLVLLLVGALAWLIFGVATGNFVDTDAKRVGERAKILADRNAEDAKLLHDPASWQDKGKGIVRVPIERAMALAAADLQKVTPHPAYPLTQSPPQPANAPAAPGASAAPMAGGSPAPVAPAAPAPAAANPPASVPAATPTASAPTATTPPAPAPTTSPTPTTAPAVGPTATPAGAP